MTLLAKDALADLKGTRSLLAFSAGADSTALLFCLLQAEISFDIASVHYGLREQADEEVAYAQELAKRYQCTCHLLYADEISSNFESEARTIRYDFFQTLIKEYAYSHLLTAHHLQDRLEWMLMQLCKGAGLAELTNMQEKEQRLHYILRRPFLQLSKTEIISYLQDANIKFFHDESNDDLSIKRNYFRHEIASKMIHKYPQGIKQSFAYLEEDKHDFIKDIQIHTAQKLSIFVSSGHKRSDIFHIDKILKSKGILIGAAQRQALKVQTEIIVARQYLVVLNNNIFYIAPYITDNMDKDFKETCRQLTIPSKLRPYLFKEPLAFSLYTEFQAPKANILPQ